MSPKMSRPYGLDLFDAIMKMKPVILCKERNVVMQFSKVSGVGSAVTGYYFDTGTGVETRFTVPHNLSKQDISRIDMNESVCDVFWEKLSEKYKLLDVDAAFGQAVRGGEPYDALCVSLTADKAVSYSSFMNVIHEVERGINKSIMTGWDLSSKVREEDVKHSLKDALDALSTQNEEALCK